MRIYVAGPMTGLPDFNYPAFFKAEEALLAVGHEVENPARNPAPDDGAWIGYMRQSLVQISRVDGIALLPGWQSSRGATVEYDLGKSLGLDVRPIDAWLKESAA